MNSLNEKAYTILKDQILEGQLAYDAIYSETRLAKELNISRTPLREALQKLEMEGYLDIIPSKGFTLHKITAREIDHALEMSSSMQTYAVMCITRDFQSPASLVIFSRLHENLTKMQQNLTETQDFTDFLQLDLEFHTCISDYLQNPFVDSSFAILVHRLKLLCQNHFHNERIMNEIYQEHRNILLAMIDGKTDKACRCILEHTEKPRSLDIEQIISE